MEINKQIQNENQQNKDLIFFFLKKKKDKQNRQTLSQVNQKEEKIQV